MKSSASVIIPDYGDIPDFEKIDLHVRDWHDGMLVRTPNWLGDAVMAIPALTMFRSVLPPCCGLFVATPKAFVPLFESMKIADRIIPIKDPHAFPDRKCIISMRRLQAGVGILLNNSFRDALIMKMAFIPKLYGARARFRSLLLKQSFSFPKRITYELNKPHQAAKYMAIAKAFGSSPWNGAFPVADDPVSKELTRPELEFLDSFPHLLTVAAGAAYGAAKRWPAESFGRVCAEWVSRGGTVVTVGTKEEFDIAREVLRDLPENKVRNLSGATSMEELIHVLKRSEKCLANDSGVMHLAAALGVPGIAPFGPTDPVATGPVSKHWRMIFEKRDCSPCFKRVCPKTRRVCFDPVTPELVADELFKEI